MANAFNFSSSTPAAPAGSQNVTFQNDASSIPNVSAYVPALTFSAPLVDTSNVVSMPVATASADGYLSHTDWATFNAKQAALTFPLSVAQGGTGEITASAARTNLGAAASGANSDITSLSGLTTPLSIAQGGTGASSAVTALSNLGGIALSANNAFTGNNTFAGTTGLNGAVTLGAGLNLNAQAISGAATFGGNLTFNGSSTFGGNCFFTPSSPQFFNTSNVTWQEFQIIAVHGGTAANDQFAIQYNSRSSSGGSDVWGSVLTVAAQTGALALNTATALNGAVTLNAGLNLNGQTISGNATFSGALSIDATLFLAAIGTATSSANDNSNSLVFDASYWTGSAASTDSWTVDVALGSGSNPSSTLTFSHSGSSGTAVVSLPALTCGAATFTGATALNGAVTLGAGLNLNGQAISGNATFTGGLTFSGSVALPSGATFGGSALGAAAFIGLPVSIANGGTGQTSASAAFNALSPFTTLGDLLYGGASGAGTRLAGNTSSTKEFLTQTGTGSASAAPAWAALASGDVTGALGYTPLKPANNLSDVTNAATALYNIGAASLSAANTFGGFQTFSSAAIFNNTVNFNGSCFSTPSSPEYFSTVNVSWQEFQLTAIKGTSAANDLLAVQYNSRSTSGGTDSWENAFTMAAQSGAVQFSTGVSIDAALSMLVLATPAAPTVTPTGTSGSTSYSYKIVAKQADGSYAAASAAGSTTTGNATLSSTNYNALSWTAVSNAASYDIYRVTGGSTQGKISNVTTNSYNDQGATGDGTTAPTINVTGAIYATGGNGALSIPGSLDILALSNPSAPTITTHGTAGSTSYSYVVIALQADGSTTAASSAGSTATGNATLSSSNYNIVTWTAVPMAVSYSVYRTSGGATQGKIASGLTSLSVNDTGLTGDGTIAPSTNTTGSLTANGNVNLNGTTTLGAALNLNGQTISGSAALSGQTLSGNATLSGTITCSGSLAISTPANISFGSGWQTWTPTISATGGMTTSGASGSALYIRIGPWIFFQINYSTTLGGTASNAVIFSVPISSSSQGGTVSPAAGVISIVGQTFAPAMLYVNSSNQIVCYVNSGANYPSGAATFYISGFYRCA